MKWFNPEKGFGFITPRWQQRCVCPFLSNQSNDFKTLTRESGS
ncbi:hypothetical protein ACLK1S_09770 [Escherichia coli]